MVFAAAGSAILLREPCPPSFPPLSSRSADPVQCVSVHMVLQVPRALAQRAQVPRLPPRGQAAAEVGERHRARAEERTEVSPVQGTGTPGDEPGRWRGGRWAGGWVDGRKEGWVGQGGRSDGWMDG